MKYPQLSLRESNAPYMEEMKTAAAEVIEGGWYIRGKYVSRLEEQLCAYLGCRYAVATGNGLDALRLMLRAYIEMGVMPVSYTHLVRQEPAIGETGKASFQLCRGRSLFLP